RRSIGGSSPERRRLTFRGIHGSVRTPTASPPCGFTRSFAPTARHTVRRKRRSSERLSASRRGRPVCRSAADLCVGPQGGHVGPPLQQIISLDRKTPSAAGASSC